jgi:hypothetical protein
VPAAQQEAIQELARAIVREVGISQDPKVQARLEGTKLVTEAATTLVLVGSGLLVGMASLREADLSGAKGWTEEQLSEARSLEGATMPNGQKYEDWLKDRENHKEDGENE